MQFGIQSPEPDMRAVSALALAFWVALAAPALASPIYQSGGPVMSGPNSVYFIWYGNWSGNTATSLLPQFISNLSGSTYMNILSSYDQPGVYPDFSTQVSSASYFITPTSSLYQGTSLDGTPGSTSAASITGIVNAVLNAGGITGYNPATSIFDVLTATDTTVSGFQTSFCGWHYSTRWGQQTTGIQYGFIGDPTSSACAYQTASSPNNNPGADAMASVIAHEFFESVTDPTGMSWYDSISPVGNGNTGGYENGDMCNFNFGTAVYQAPNGSAANVALNGTNYLLQTQWQNQGGGVNYQGGACVTSLAFATPTPEPPTAALLLAGLVGLGLVRARRRVPA